MIDYRIGDGRALIANVPDGSVHLVATSPPFLALRSYLPADHEHKHAEIGSEPDPATFLDTLLGLTAEWGRVLAPWGSIAIELGDTYAGSGGAGGDYNADGLREGQGKFDGSNRAGKNGRHSMVENATGGHHMGGNGWPRPKCLALIPQLYATSLAYGRNILTGAPSPAGQWLVRNLIVWHRPNPAVGALGDKFRPSTSYIVVATRSPKRWFDLTAVRGEPNARTNEPAGGRLPALNPGENGTERQRSNPASNPSGAPPLDAWFDEHDTWTVTTQPSRLSHYAMWPAKLAERLILSMCPEWVCSTCGEPRRRMEAVTGLVDQRGRQVPRVNWQSGMATQKDGGGQLGAMSLKTTGGTTTTTTTGWTDCGHDDYAPGTTLDPFCGTGTTLVTADLHGRHGIGFDIDARNAELVDARRAEVARNLFGTIPEIPGQLDMFGGAA